MTELKTLIATDLCQHCATVFGTFLVKKSSKMLLNLLWGPKTTVPPPRSDDFFGKRVRDLQEIALIR